MKLEFEMLRKLASLEETLSLGEKYLKELDYERVVTYYRAAIELDRV